MLRLSITHMAFCLMTAIGKVKIANENKIKTRDELADLSNEELIEIFKDMDLEKADSIIMESRKHWYKD